MTKRRVLRRVLFLISTASLVSSFFWMSQYELKTTVTSFLAPTVLAQKGVNESSPSPSDVRPTLKQQHRVIPTMRNGGVVFFYHVNKVGGLSLKLNLQRLPNVVYTFSMGGNQMLFGNIAQVMDNWATRQVVFSNSTIYIMEVHSRGNPSFAREYERLMSWRSAFRNELGVPFVAFTVVRDPLSHLVSAFNFICIKNKRCERRKQSFAHVKDAAAVGGVEDLLSLAHPNLQCRYYLRQWLPLAFDETHLQRAPTEKECIDLYEGMMSPFFDWIGRTERFNETINVLEKVIFGKNASGMWSSTWRNTNVTPKRLPGAVAVSMLNDSARSYLENITSLDRDLHKRVGDDYCLENVLFL